MGAADTVKKREGRSCPTPRSSLPTGPVSIFSEGQPVEEALMRRCPQGMTGFKHDSVSWQEVGLTADENKI